MNGSNLHIRYTANPVAFMARHRKRDSFSVRLAQVELGGWKRLKTTSSLANYHWAGSWGHHICMNSKSYIHNLYIYVRDKARFGKIFSYFLLKLQSLLTLYTLGFNTKQCDKYFLIMVLRIFRKFQACNPCIKGIMDYMNIGHYQINSINGLNIIRKTSSWQQWILL